MPRNIVPRIAPIHINVVRAFRHSGGLERGDPVRDRLDAGHRGRTRCQGVHGEEERD